MVELRLYKYDNTLLLNTMIEPQAETAKLKLLIYSLQSKLKTVELKLRIERRKSDDLARTITQMKHKGE